MNVATLIELNESTHAASSTLSSEWQAVHTQEGKTVPFISTYTLVDTDLIGEHVAIDSSTVISLSV